MARISVYDGMLYQPANPAAGTALEDLEGYDPFEFETDLLFQVYDENGRPLTATTRGAYLGSQRGASYRGTGLVVAREGGKQAVIMGNPQNPESRLAEYEMDSDPTPESLARYDAMRAGILDATSTFKQDRKRDSRKGQDYLAGFDKAVKALKATKARSR